LRNLKISLPLLICHPVVCDDSFMTQHDFLLKQATSAVHEMSLRIPMLLVDIFS
jgi:hypothetical protein